MSEWKEDAIRHKYEPIPEEPPRHRKRAKRQHVRSDHKHIYEDVCVDTGSCNIYRMNKKVPFFHVAKRCSVCGRICNVTIRLREVEPPDGMPLYEVDDYLEFATMDALPERYRVRSSTPRLKPEA